jgi:hypothetical protein
MIREVYPGSGFFYSGSQIPDPGVKKAPDPGSATMVKMKERKKLNLIEQRETQSCRTFREASFSYIFCSVADPCHFGADPDPDPRICASN